MWHGETEESLESGNCFYKLKYNDPYGQFIVATGHKFTIRAAN